jgi:leucine dehydrogenase
MRAAVKQVFGNSSLDGRTVLVQGVGDVGAPLARFVAEAGGRVLVSDMDAERAERMAQELGGIVVPTGKIFETPCDIYAPCAVGATLNSRTIPRLACRIVAGSANNQLEEPKDADRLAARGILYAPDYVVNAGGATALPLLGEGVDPEEIRARIRRFEGILSEIFEEAAERGESPYYAAERRAERVLQKGRERREAQ